MQQSILQPGAAEQIRQLWGREGFSLDDSQLGQLTLYLELLNKWNRVHSLTAIEDPHDQVCRHILDGLSIWPFIAARFGTNPSISLADVGSGMGVPGIVLAVAMPKVRIDLIERNQKKAAFLRQACARLGLGPRARVVALDVSSIKPSPEYDLITSRAFAALPAFLELTIGISGKGTIWAAMLGREKDKKSDHILIKKDGETLDMIVKDVIRIDVEGVQGLRHLAWVGRAN